MKTKSVSIRQIAEHPDMSLKARDYLDPRYAMIIGQEFNRETIEEVFEEKNIKCFGNNRIGETFLVCHDPDQSNNVWSFILIRVDILHERFRLIYKYDNG